MKMTEEKLEGFPSHSKTFIFYNLNMLWKPPEEMKNKPKIMRSQTNKL